MYFIRMFIVAFIFLNFAILDLMYPLRKQDRQIQDVDQ